MEKEKIELTISSDTIKCLNCIYATDNHYDCHCAKFKIKPSDVLYESAECPKFKEE